MIDRELLYESDQGHRHGWYVYRAGRRLPRLLISTG